MQIVPLFQVIALLPTQRWSPIIALVNLIFLSGFIFFTILNPLLGYKWFAAKAICTFAIHIAIIVEAYRKRLHRVGLKFQFGWIFNAWTALLVALEATIAILGGDSWIYPAYSTVVAKMCSMIMVAATKRMTMEFVALKRVVRGKNLDELRKKCLDVLDDGKIVEHAFSLTLLATQFLIFVQLILDFYNLYLALLASGELIGKLCSKICVIAHVQPLAFSICAWTSSLHGNFLQFHRAIDFPVCMRRL